MTQAGFTYTLPDGSDDTPTQDGRHTAAVNVMHSAKQFERFHGCEQCASLARMQAELDDIAAAGFWWSEANQWRRFTREGDTLTLVAATSYTYPEALAVARAYKMLRSTT